MLRAYHEDIKHFCLKSKQPLFRSLGSCSVLNDVKSLCEDGNLKTAIKTVQQLDLRRNYSLCMKIFDSLIDYCISNEDFTCSKDVQNLIARNGFESNAFLGRRLIRMFTSFGNHTQAIEVFYRLLEPDVFTWSCIILALVRLGYCHQAITLFQRMLLANIGLDAHTFAATLKACTYTKSVYQGKIVHLYIIESNLTTNVVVGNALINMYICSGLLEQAQIVFFNLQDRDTVSWNTMIGGYIECKRGLEAIELFFQMQVEGIQADRVTYINFLKACVDFEMIAHGKWIHGVLIQKGAPIHESICNILIEFYARYHSVEESWKVFWQMPTHSVMSWNALIDASGQQGHSTQALQLFDKMQEQCVDPDENIFASVLRSCADAFALDQGRYIHAYIVKKGLYLDVVVGTCLVNLYCRCGSLLEAQTVFEEMQEVNIVTWSAMIAGHAQHGHWNVVIYLFSEMQHEGIYPNQATYVSVLNMCNYIVDLFIGILLHNEIIKEGYETDLFIISALLKLYINCGSLVDARSIFDGLSKKNVVIYNLMMSGYVEKEQSGDVLKLFNDMQGKQISPNELTVVIVLKATSIATAFEQGKEVHGYIAEKDIKVDIHLSSCLIMMYCLCGSLEDGCHVFESGPKENITVWNAVLTGCAQHRNYVLALKYFENMKLKHLRPNCGTFTSLLSACSSAGKIDTAIWLFKVMTNDYNIMPEYNHYECFINLLARTGHLNDAKNLLFTNLPLQTHVNCAGWTALLNHCRIHGNIEIGEQCFEHWTALL